MAGHSKWANIKYRKGAQDKKKGKIFGQLSRQIRAAVKEGGSGDPDQNPTLRTILEKAREANMPKENIKRAINRGLGKSDAGQLQEIVYEGFGAGGIGVLVSVVTDNVNRMSSDLKFLFSKYGGSLGSPGCVKYMFARQESGEEAYLCTMPITVNDPATQEKLQDLINALLEIDDVEEVFCAGVWAGRE
jgi:YebC/PmpR family DNA-binding regulatory protein